MLRLLQGFRATGALASIVALVASGCGGKTATPIDAAMESAANPDTSDLGGGLHGTCPTTLQGPTMARVSWSQGVAFCIDTTEVTNAEYQKFLSAPAPAPSARCQWNSSLAPSATGAGCSTFDPVGRAEFPVVCVDWCDAEAYCRWAGKYLCRAGSPDGNDPGPVTNPAAVGGSEWIIACTNDGKSTYPYGNEAISGRCVDKKFPATTAGVQPVKAATMCEGGITGVFDMAGNASEWQNNCVESKTSADGKDDACDAYGGAQSSDYIDTSCTAATSPLDTAAHFKRAQFAADNGFRCCAAALF